MTNGSSQPTGKSSPPASKLPFDRLLKLLASYAWIGLQWLKRKTLVLRDSLWGWARKYRKRVGIGSLLVPIAIWFVTTCFFTGFNPVWGNRLQFCLTSGSAPPKSPPTEAITDKATEVAVPVASPSPTAASATETTPPNRLPSLTPTVSKGNGQIAFASFARTCTEQGDLCWDIYLLDILDGKPDNNPVRLTNFTSGNNTHPAWSADGKRIAFDRDDGRGDPEIYIITNIDDVIRGQGRPASKPITADNVEDFEPAWSPDGCRIAYSASTMGTGLKDVQVINADGTNAKNLTFVPGRDGPNIEPAWSPDGKQIAFVSYRDGGPGEIYVMDANGQNQKRLTNNSAEDRSPAWSPDGLKIAYTSHTNGPDDIWIMDMRDGSTMNITTDIRGVEEGDYRSPSWSPDGKLIAFYLHSKILGGDEIYMIDSNGTNPVRLTNNTYEDRDPVWRPMNSNQPSVSNCSN